jgi:hypothetical protein
MLEVVLPRLRSELLAARRGEGGEGAEDGDKPVTFWYQYPPTLRLQPGPSAEHGRAHRDSEYTWATTF